jgi:hypothetical protein
MFTTHRHSSARTIAIVLIVIGLVAVLAINWFSTQLPIEGGKAKVVDSAATGEREEAEKRAAGSPLPAALLTIEKSPMRSALTTGFDAERLWSAYNDWEPAIAVDPSSSYVYQLTTRYDGPAACRNCPAPYIIFRRSSDGGATWGADQFLGYGRKSNNDPQIEVAGDGAIYTAWMNDYTPGIMFAKSTDRGQTWSTPIALIAKGGKPTWSDKPILAISPNGKDVYIAFNASDAYVTVSHNYGVTFSKPLKISSDKRYWFHTGGAVAPNGAVYFAAVDYSQDYTGDAYISVMKSTNGGTTWTTTRVDTSKQMPDCAWSPGCTLGFFGPSAALAIDKAGTIMIAYNAGDVASQPQKMWARTSTDGVNWTSRVEISNGSGTVNNGFPALATGPTAGDFRIAWQDDRNGSTTAWNTWYRSTTNSGGTWSAPVRLSDLGSGAPYKNPNGYAFPYGDYFEIAVDTSGTAHVVWGEGSNYNGPGGTWYTRGK